MPILIFSTTISTGTRRSPVRLFVTDNVFRIEGGDEIAKYNISLGYTNEGGIVDNTSSQRFHTLINSNVMVSRWVDIFTNVNLAYITSDLQEPGP